MIDPLVTCPSLLPGVPTCPSTFEVSRVRERIPTPSVVFIFELAFESYEEFGGASF